MEALGLVFYQSISWLLSSIPAQETLPWPRFYKELETHVQLAIHLHTSWACCDRAAGYSSEWKPSAGQVSVTLSCRLQHWGCSPLSNDLLCSMNGNKVGLFTFMGLCAAFDTIDHGLLLHQLEFENGIKRLALALLSSYLAEYCQHVKVRHDMRHLLTMHYSVLSLKALYLAPSCSPFTVHSWDRS